MRVKGGREGAESLWVDCPPLPHLPLASDTAAAIDLLEAMPQPVDCLRHYTDTKYYISSP